MAPTKGTKTRTNAKTFRKKSVRFYPKVRSESGKQTPLEEPAGFSSNQPNYDKERDANTQQDDEYNNARRDPTNKIPRRKGEHLPYSSDVANELFFDGIDNREKRGIFRDKYDRYFFIGTAALASALASAKAFGLFGGKIQKTKRRKNKNRKTKRRK